MTSRVLVSLRVSASPERAFDVFVSEIGQWWRPNELFRFTLRSPGVVALEPGLGGRFTETLPNGKVFEIGRITVWEPGHRIAFQLAAGHVRTRPDHACGGPVRAYRQ